MVGAIEQMFNNSDLALAAYSDLTQGVPTNQQIDALKQSGDGMSQVQAEWFAVRYPAVLSVANYPESGFQATVFKSSDGQLAVAFRGTKDFFTDVIDADKKQIFTNGAAYNQIVDMYNWWKCVTTQRGEYIQQYEIQPIVVGAMPPSNGVLLFSQDAVDPDISDAALDFYLVPKVAAVATGELVGQADLSAVSVTGHSLGGHLASAFTALFNGQVENTYTYTDGVLGLLIQKLTKLFLRHWKVLQQIMLSCLPMWQTRSHAYRQITHYPVKANWNLSVIYMAELPVHWFRLLWKTKALVRVTTALLT